MRQQPSKLPSALVCLCIGLAAPFSAGAAQQAASAPDAGLSMVPQRCFAARRQLVGLENVVVFHNRIVNFRIGDVAVRSELMGSTVLVRYTGENATAIFQPLVIARYNASDARLYHGTLDGAPIVIWEETVENIPRRVGIIGYRGRIMYAICDGTVRAGLRD